MVPRRQPGPAMNTVTLDTYRHLIAGAEAAAIASTADITSVPAVLAATGTDPVPAGTCFAFDSKLDASVCVEPATECDEGSLSGDGSAPENPAILY